MDKLKMTELPKTFNGQILNVPEKTWNKLIKYISEVTDNLNNLSTQLEILESKLTNLSNGFEQNLKTTKEQFDTTQENLRIIAEVLEDLVQND